jgi:hypothetical protein
MAQAAVRGQAHAWGDHRAPAGRGGVATTILVTDVVQRRRRPKNRCGAAYLLDMLL